MLSGNPNRFGRACAVLLVAFAAGAATARVDDRPVREDESVHFLRLSVEDGLSEVAVNCIAQDQQGFMWFGTQDGLNRYDGYRFTVFHHDPAEPGSLANNYVWALHVDRQGVLWVGTRGGGLDRFDPASETFTHHRHDAARADSLGDDRIRAIAEAPDGVLWIGTEGGLSRLAADRSSFRSYSYDDTRPGSLADNAVRSILVDRSGVLWVGTEGGGLDRLFAEQDAFVHYRHNPRDPRTLSSDRIRAVWEDEAGTIWVGTYESGLNRLDPVTGRITRYEHDPALPTSLSHNRVRAVLGDADGALWVGTDNGLNRIAPGSDTFVRFTHDAADPHSLSGNRVLSLFQDRGGVFWVGTQSGLNRWNPEVHRFAHYRQKGGTEGGLASNIVNAFATDPDGVLWIGTYAGLSALDRRSGRYRKFVHDPADDTSLADDRVMSLLSDRDGVLWIGTLEGGLGRLDRRTGRFTSFRHTPGNPRSLGANGVTALHEAPDGTLWIGTYGGGLNRYDAQTRSFHAYRHDPEDPASLGDDRVMAVRSDRGGAIWVGAEGGGLDQLDPATGRVAHVHSDPNDPASLAVGTVWSILESRDGTLWIGTQGGGLSRWAPEDRTSGRARFRTYTEKDGLANNFIYGILEDALGRLWLSSNKGISLLDPRTDQVITFDTTHGLQSNEFNFGAYHANTDGEMFFGGNNGFNAFHPARVGTNRHVPPVVLTSIRRLNEALRFDRPLAQLGEVTFGYKDYVVSFEFAALDYTAPWKNRYAYRLEGFDSNWIELGNLRRATYTNLPAGRYALHVRGSNSDGLWNEAGIQLAIRVLPAPWRTWWAYTLYGLAAACVVFAYVRAQRRKRELEAEYRRRLEREVGERTADLAEANDRLQAMSLTDPLTGLRNRRYAVNRLAAEAEVARRARLAPGGAHGPPPTWLLLMLDLDGFKHINDTFGHAAGDSCLQTVAEILRNVFRASDELIRWGGDEFLILCRNVDGRGAEMLAERLRHAFGAASLDLGPGGGTHIGCSIGFAQFPFVPSAPGQVPWEKVQGIADRAMYLSKRHGRNGWLGVLSTDRPIPEPLLAEITDLPEALLRNGLVVLTSNRSDLVSLEPSQSASSSPAAAEEVLVRS